MSEGNDPTSQDVDKCFLILEDGILNNRITPGSSLDRKKLNKTLNFDSNILDEALYRLSMTDLVNTHEQSGYMVRKFQRHEVIDIYQTFSQIELLAMKLAIRYSTREWETNIMSKLYKLSLLEKSQLSVTYSEWAQLNDEFHYAIVAGCGSDQLLTIRNHLYQHIARFTYLQFLAKGTMCMKYEEHEALAKAVIGKKEDEACQLLLKLLESPEEALIPLLANRGWVD